MDKNTKIQLQQTEKLFKLFSITTARDKRLSYKARGVLFYLLSKPDGWKGRVFDLVNNSDRDGINTIKSALRELVDCGYARLKTERTKEGKLLGKYYEISEFPTKK